VTNDRQAQSQSRMTASARIVGLAETIEHIRKECRVDADSRVADSELDLTSIDASADIHASALRRELDRVRQHIPHSLLKPCRIAGDRAACRIDDGTDGDVLRAGGGENRLNSGFDNIAQIHRDWVEAHLAADHS